MQAWLNQIYKKCYSAIFCLLEAAFKCHLAQKFEGARAYDASAPYICLSLSMRQLLFLVFKTDSASLQASLQCKLTDIHNYNWNRKLLHSVIFPPHFRSGSLSHRRAQHTQHISAFRVYLDGEGRGLKMKDERCNIRPAGVTNTSLNK